MESVITVVKGTELEIVGQCQFCTKQATSLFGVITDKRWDGFLLKSFKICSEHLDKLNALLSGEYDIDDMFLEKYKMTGGKGINLRR